MQDAPAIQGNGSSEAPLPTCFASRRRSLRRAITFDCNLESKAWDGMVMLSATDISDEGLWVETPYALSEGEELVVSFDVPGAHEPGRVWAVAQVARVGLWRRRSDAQPSGMGLVFTYCSDDDRARLRAALRGLPPPLPAQLTRASLPPPLPLPVEVSGSVGEQNEDIQADALPAVLDWQLAGE